MYVRIMHKGSNADRAVGSGSGLALADDGAAADAAPSLAGRRELVRAVESALAGVEGVLHQCLGSDLGEAFAELDALSRRVEAARVAVLAEALERGEVASSECASPTAWVVRWGESFRSGGAADLVRVAQACIGRPAGLGGEHLRGADGSGCGQLRAAVLSGRVPVRSAAVALAEMHKLVPRLCPEAVRTVWSGFLDVAAQAGPRGEREFQGRADRLKHGVSLSRGRADDGMVEYLLRLDPEGASVLEAAIGPLSAPNPVEGVSDLRSTDQRRGDALVEACRRSAAAGGEAPAQTKAQVFVTMNLDDLKDACGSGTVLGNATLLAPETVRRIACDAAVIPVVLGTQGEVLELGRKRRLFSPGQLAALWLGDKGCTIPGCHAPPWWCDGHHVIHWANGGPTDVGNAALLCGRHHTIVHQRGWTATVTSTGVTWHT